MIAGHRDDSGAAAAGDEPALQGVTETAWGYVVAAGGTLSRNAAAIERAAWLAALALFALAGGHWLVPVVHGLLGLGTQIALSVALGLVGLALSWLADRGLLEEVQVDLEARTLRWTLGNARGGLRILREVGFDEIGSVFVHRAEGPGQPARLCVRVGRGDEQIELARGREPWLIAIQQRLARDLQGSSLRKVNPGRRGRRRRGLARPLSHAA